METPAPTIPPWRLVLAVSGCGFLLVACLCLALGVGGWMDSRAMTQLVPSFAAVGVLHLLLLPWERRSRTYQEVPSGGSAADWAEGVVLEPRVRRLWFLPVGDRCRIGVTGEGLRVRRAVRVGIAAVVVVVVLILSDAAILSLRAVAPRGVDLRLLVFLSVVAPTLGAFLALLAFDSPSDRHDVLRPWSDVAGVVGTHDTLSVHWMDGSAPLVVGISPYAIRRILARLEGHVRVQVRTPLPASGWPPSVDAGTAQDLNQALENLRRLEP